VSIAKFFFLGGGAHSGTRATNINQQQTSSDKAIQESSDYEEPPTNAYIMGEN